MSAFFYWVGVTFCAIGALIGIWILIHATLTALSILSFQIVVAHRRRTLSKLKWHMLPLEFAALMAADLSGDTANALICNQGEWHGIFDWRMKAGPQQERQP